MSEAPERPASRPALSPAGASLASTFGSAAVGLRSVVLAAFDAVNGLDVLEAAAHRAIIERAARAISRAIRALRGATRRYIREDAPRVYDDALGAEPSGPHGEARDSAVGELAERLSSAASDMEADAARSLRAILRARTEAILAGESGLGEEAEALREDIADIKIKDRSGRRWEPGNYARLVLRTVTSELRNRGAVHRASLEGAPGVRVSDGDYDAECREADGQAWSLAYAARNPLHHPNCLREFSPLPVDWRGELDRG